MASPVAVTGRGESTYGRSLVAQSGVGKGKLKQQQWLTRIPKRGRGMLLHTLASASNNAAAVAPCENPVACTGPAGWI